MTREVEIYFPTPFLSNDASLSHFNVETHHEVLRGFSAFSKNIGRGSGDEMSGLARHLGNWIVL